MIRKSFTAAATALVIAAGALAATAGTASAGGYGYGNSYGHQASGYFITKVFYVPKKVCEPIFKTVYNYDYYGHSYATKIKVGHDCYTIQKKVVKKVWVPYSY